MHMRDKYDVVVVGGGHAGVEASCAAARVGAKVLLVTKAASDLGKMSCNPAIGGIGKGHLVREVDACGGIIGRAADRASIHRRMLNRSKGSAVHGPRVQADRALFGSAVRVEVASQQGMAVVEATVSSLLIIGDRAAGVLLDGVEVHASAVILATGTFLGGVLFRGVETFSGGRVGEMTASRLAGQIRELEPRMGRLKTGTPPRVDGRSINWAVLQHQPSDRESWWISLDRPSQPRQVRCFITHTGERSHDVIRANRKASPLYSGLIKGQGPRYCPSIEDKVVRFPDRDAHQVFLEPEGLTTSTIYPNGISTSLPTDVQEQLVRSIAGLEHASIVEPGYAVEYDFVDPRVLGRDLQHGVLHGLYMAGQINGTTGYEEAAAQGLVAGANAGRAALGLGAVHFDRSSSYIGVLVDDLILQGVSEPYRMLTARAECRLSLRADNAETRLWKLAERCSLLQGERLARARDRRRRFEELRAGYSADPTSLDDQQLLQEIETDQLYAPYLARQERENADRFAEDSRRLSSGFECLPGLSTEMKERLAAAAPRTIGEARQIRGITPAAISLLILASRNASSQTKKAPPVA